MSRKWRNWYQNEVEVTLHRYRIPLIMFCLSVCFCSSVSLFVCFPMCLYVVCSRASSAVNRPNPNRYHFAVWFPLSYAPKILMNKFVCPRNTRTLTVSRWVTLSMRRLNGQTDGRTPDRYITLSARRCQRKNSYQLVTYHIYVSYSS